MVKKLTIILTLKPIIMRKIFFLMLSLLLLGGGNVIKAQTDAEYDAALAALGDGGDCRIYTVIGGTKYYVNNSGYLVPFAFDETVFTLEKVSGGQYKTYGYKIKSGSIRFTNTELQYNSTLSKWEGNLTPGHLIVTTTNDRNVWEAQVFFLNDDGKYAIRTTNAADGGYYGSEKVYWTYSTSANDKGVSQYSESASYVWQVEDASATPTVTKLTALTDIKDSKAYAFYCPRGFLSTNNSTLVATTSGNYATTYSTFAILTYQGDKFVYSIADSKFFKLETETVGGNATNLAKEINDPSEKWLIQTSGNERYPFKFYINSTTFRANAGSRDGGDLTFNNWNNNDNGNVFLIAEIGDFPDYATVLQQIEDFVVPVTYIVKDTNNNELLNVTEYLAPGTVINELPSQLKRDFVTYSDESLTVNASGTNTITFTATWTFPFELPATYADITKWYDMSIRDTWYVTSGNKASDGALQTVNANAMGLGEDTYQWAFVGDPYHLRVFNKAEANNFSAYGVETNQGIPSFQADAYYWKIVKSNSSIANSFTLNVDGTNLHINQYGGAGGSLKFWNSANNISDAGSAFTVFDVPTDFSAYAVAEILPYLTGDCFVLKETARADIGWQDSYSTTCPFETYKAMKLALESKLENSDNIIYPETGCYRFNNRYYNKYLGLKTTTVYGNYTDEDESSPATVVVVTKNTDDKYSIAIQGKYLQEITARSTNVPIGNDPNWFTAINPFVGYGAFVVDPTSDDGYTYLHCASGGNVVGWESGAYASQWKLEKATTFNITLHNGGDGKFYGTLCAPFGVTLNDGTKAYVGIKEDGVLNLSLINTDGTNISAGEAVVLVKEDASTESTITITATINDAIAAFTGTNDLEGQYLAATAADETKLALGKSNGKVGFYKYTDPLGANKAYLPYTGSSTSNGFAFVFDDDDPTGINNAQSSMLNGQSCYDLFGRKVTAPQKGQLYIQNGKVVKY